MKLPPRLSYWRAIEAQMPMACFLLGQSMAKAVMYRGLALLSTEPIDIINNRHMARLWAKSARATHAMLIERATRSRLGPPVEIEEFSGAEFYRRFGDSGSIPSEEL